jgi:ABC-type ATPase involved in cell division
MSRFSEFFIDLERGELSALERFLERSGSLLTSKSLEASLTVLSSALQTMHKSVNDALKQIEKDAQINEVSVVMQLGEDQAAAAARAFKRLTTSELDAMLEDQEASNDVSIALWKILDVIEPVSVRL